MHYKQLCTKVEYFLIQFKTRNFRVFCTFGQGVVNKSEPCTVNPQRHHLLMHFFALKMDLFLRAPTALDFCECLQRITEQKLHNVTVHTNAAYI